MFPAHAGMDRSPTCSRQPNTSVPRPRGDGPGVASVEAEIVQCFPAHAGMDRLSMATEYVAVRIMWRTIRIVLLHMRTRRISAT